MAAKKLKKGEREGWSLMTWNVAGLRNKDKGFWTSVYDHDGVALVETWVTEKEWTNWKERLSTDFVWFCVPAVKDKTMGRAKGGIIVGIRKQIQIRKWTQGKEGMTIRHELGDGKSVGMD